MEMAKVSVICFFASYIVAFGLELTRLLRRTSINRAIMLLFGTAGLVAHTMYLIVRSGEANLPPLLSSTHDWMLVLAWLAIVFYLFLTFFDRDLAIGLFLLPLVLILIGSANFVSKEPNALVANDSELVRNALYLWGLLHATLLVFGTAGVIVGLVLSLMYVVQHWRLKRKRTLQSGLKVPSLEKLGRLNWWAVVISVPLLTLGLATGVGLGLASRSGVQPISFADPVVVVNSLVWLVMVSFFMWMLRTHRPTGTHVARRTIWAFGFLLATLILLQVLRGGGSFSFDTWHT